MIDLLTTIAVVLLACSNIMTCCKVSEQEKRIKQLEVFRDTLLESIEEKHKSYELCGMCASKEDCPAAFTGVAYPCEHVRMEERP